MLTANVVLSKVSFTVRDKGTVTSLPDAVQKTPAKMVKEKSAQHHHLPHKKHHRPKDLDDESSSDLDGNASADESCESEDSSDSVGAVHFDKSRKPSEGSIIGSEPQVPEDARWPVREKYPIQFLQRVAKAKNVCSKITIHVRPNYAAAFEYDSQIGKLCYIIAPRYDEDVGASHPPPGAARRMQMPTSAAIRRSGVGRGGGGSGRGRGGRPRRAAAAVPIEVDADDDLDVVPVKDETIHSDGDEPAVKRPRTGAKSDDDDSDVAVDDDEDMVF
jgi:hypothetical protein